MPQEATTKIQTCAQRVANPVWLHQQITALVTSCDDDIAEDQELADKESDGAKQSLYLERVASHHHWKHQLERILAGKTADEDFADTLAAQGVQP